MCGVNAEFKRGEFVAIVGESGCGEIVETITINKVNSNSISEKLGLKKDDVLISFIVNDVEYSINRRFNISDILFVIRSGDKISFKISRSGQETTTATYNVVESDLNQVA